MRRRIASASASMASAGRVLREHLSGTRPVTGPTRAGRSSGRRSASWRWISDGFLCPCERLLVAAESIEHDGQIIQGPSQIGQEGCWALLRQLAVEADGFLSLARASRGGRGC